MLQKLKKYAMIYLYCQVFGEYIRKEMTFGTNNHHRCASDIVCCVFGGGDCVNIVYNAAPVWMGDRLEELKGADLRFMWTVESPREMLDVLRRYEAGEAGEGRRIR